MTKRERSIERGLAVLLRLYVATGGKGAEWRKAVAIFVEAVGR